MLDYTFKKNNVLELVEYINNKGFQKTLISVWEKIFPTFFEDLDFNKKANLAYIFEKLAWFHQTQVYFSELDIETLSFYVAYGLVCESNYTYEPKEIIDFMICKLYNSTFNSTYDYVIDCVLALKK